MTARRRLRPDRPLARPTPPVPLDDDNPDQPCAYEMCFAACGLAPLVTAKRGRLVCVACGRRLS